MIAGFLSDAVVARESLGGQTELGGEYGQDAQAGGMGGAHVAAEEGLLLKYDGRQGPAGRVLENGVFGDVEEGCCIGSALCIGFGGTDGFEAGE